MSEVTALVNEDTGKTRVLLQSGFAVPLDMTDVYRFDQYANELTSVTSLSGPMYMQKLLEAFNLVSHMAARVTHEYEKAKEEAKRIRAIAHLHRAPTWLEENKRKVTESACEQYVEIDNDYIVAREKEAYLKALSELMDNRIQYFRAAHDDAKCIYRAAAEPRGGSTSSVPSGQ